MQQYDPNIPDKQNLAQTDLGRIKDNFNSLRSHEEGDIPPANPVAGMIWKTGLNPSGYIAKSYYMRDTTNTTWVYLFGEDNLPLVDPSNSAQGDILIRDANGWTRLPAGNNGDALFSQGANKNPIWQSGSRMQIFTSSGIFTVPPTVTQVLVTLVAGGGGGGGGGAASYSCGGGGGGGGGAGNYLLRHPFNVTPGEVIPVTVGQGGSGGSGAGYGSYVSGHNGSDGQPSSFGSYISVDGGGHAGGGHSVPDSYAGGLAGMHRGHMSNISTNGNAGTPSTGGSGGHGGGTVWGTKGFEQNTGGGGGSAGGHGGSAHFTHWGAGGGGGGGGNIELSGGGNGGNGMQGICIVEW
jgi:hypothetical protein